MPFFDWNSTNLKPSFSSCGFCVTSKNEIISQNFLLKKLPKLVFAFDNAFLLHNFIVFGELIIISFYFSKSKFAHSANSIYGFCKFRLDAPKELLEQLQSVDNIPQKLLIFKLATSKSNGKQVHIILLTIMVSKCVESLNLTKERREEEMKPC